MTVSIKPLEWTEFDTGWWFAKTGFDTRYEVRETDRGNTRIRTPLGIWCDFAGTLEQAKASFQADYETRIRAALAHDEQAEPVGWQPKRSAYQREKLPHASEWLYSIYPTRVDAELISNAVEVRPLYAAPVPEQAEPVGAAKLLETLRWAHGTLQEINPSNYTHDDVCSLNHASVEVILGIAPLIGEKHGKSDEWWLQRPAGVPEQAPTHDGFTLVPTEPNPEMIGAWYRYKNGHRFPGDPPVMDTSDYGAYRAMLAASPRSAS